MTKKQTSRNGTLLSHYRRFEKCIVWSVVLKGLNVEILDRWMDKTRLYIQPLLKNCLTVNEKTDITKFILKYINLNI